MTITLRATGGERKQIGFDYRRMGTCPGMPAQVPIDRCRRVRGIRVYAPEELVRRKLHTIVGARPRLKARDIYDAAWIVSEHPELVGAEEAAKLREWLDAMTPRTGEERRERMRTDPLSGRVSTPEVWETLNNGIVGLEASLSR